MENEKYEKCRLLGFYVALLRSKAFRATWPKKEWIQDLEVFGELTDGIEMISTSLDLNLSPSDYGVKGESFINQPVTKLFKLCFESDPIGIQLSKTHGSSAEFIYRLSQTTLMTREVCKFLSLFSEFAYLSNSERLVTKSEIQQGDELIKQYLNFLSNNPSHLRKFFPEVADNFQNFCNTPLSAYERYNELRLDFIIKSFVPEYYELPARLKIANQLTEALKTCKPGRVNWRKYEQLGIQIVRFLFVPPFKKVIEQSRTESGDSRRDVVLPNNQYSGFWRLVRDEFDSRHVICEFKNYLTQPSKSQLNQLRVYLNRPTVGRFGLLFIRHAPSRQLLEARHRAYEESKALILILDDKLVEKMLKMRALIGCPEEILEELKIQFELSY